MLNATITSKDKAGNRISYPIETFNKPLDWQSFKGYPLEFQRLYISKLKEKYNVTQGRIADMFGIHFTTFSKYCSDPLKIQFMSHRMSDAEVEAFESFCSKMETKKKDIAYKGESAYDNGSMNQIKVTEEAKIDIPIVIDDKPSPIIEVVQRKKEREEKDASSIKSNLKGIVLNFEGRLDTSSVLFTLDRLLDRDVTGRMRIEIELD